MKDDEKVRKFDHDDPKMCIDCGMFMPPEDHCCQPKGEQEEVEKEEKIIIHMMKFNSERFMTLCNIERGVIHKSTNYESIVTCPLCLMVMMSNNAKHTQKDTTEEGCKCIECGEEMDTFNDGYTPSKYCPECYYKKKDTKKPTVERICDQYCKCGHRLCDHDPYGDEGLGNCIWCDCSDYVHKPQSEDKEGK